MAPLNRHNEQNAVVGIGQVAEDGAGRGDQRVDQWIVDQREQHMIAGFHVVENGRHRRRH
ncbi:MAG: hypothetical protein IPK17_13810 [Chloroflexi bacterium]|uniref:hypothetical protein n=1 Tax=Candidatus Flexifilum breve TaxID=3140694 RepID=UPI003135B89D|nr:hypothetical protein [Chloroflexota bacterium]